MVDIMPSIFDRLRMPGTPIANPNSMVIVGQARFTILTSRLIRLEWSPTSQFEDRGTYAFPNRLAETPEFSQELQGTHLTIKTDYLTLTYINDGKAFNSSNLSIEFDLNGQLVKWSPGMKNPANLRGTRRTLDLCAAGISLQEGLLSRDGWSLIDDSGLPVWDVDQYWVEPRPDEHLCDWYFFGYGHDYKAALSEYMHFGGQIPLIPRYVLGAWWSRYWAYSADDLKQLVKDFEWYGIPLDVLVVDMDWHTPDGWTGYTWNRDLFPDPEAFLAWVHEQNLSVTLNLHPAEGVQSHEEPYAEFAERLGHDAAQRDGIAFRPTDKAFMQSYFELLHHPLEEQGVDFWWLDWQQGEATEIKNLDPLAWLNHLHFQDSSRRGNRPMLYSRWGGLGNHRYPIGFSGDTYATWDALRFQPYFTATAANVGYGWWSHDIGGHLGASDPELYARWVQFGAVSPCLRLHSSKDPLAERRPWAFPSEIFEAAKAAIQLRYQLLPYLYSAAHSAAKNGSSLCTPMYYEYPEVEDAYLAHGQYFFGDQLIVAPIVNPTDPQTGLAPIDVWIPEGTWIEYTTLETFSGPKWVRLYGDINRIPMFARAGAIIPMAAPLMRTKEFDGSHVVLTLFPGANGQFELYEDDGITQDYSDGAYQTTCIQSAILDYQTLSISISAAEGDCPALSAKRTFEIHLKGISDPNYITVIQSNDTTWYYDQDTNELVIWLKDVDRRVPVEIVVNTHKAIASLIYTQNVSPILADITKLAHLSHLPLSIAHALETRYSKEIKGAAFARLGSPFISFIDYELYEESSHQLGTAIIVPAADNTPFDVEFEWVLQRGANTTTIPMTFKHCTSRQIVHNPFSDDGSLSAFRWYVSAKIHWQGQSFEYNYQSKDAYPSINRWNTLIYNCDQQPLSLEDVISADGNGDLNPNLAWNIAEQSVVTMRNIKEPFGVVLSENTRQRVQAGEPLEVCLSATVVSQAALDLVLHIECVGKYRGYLNGVELLPTAPIPHTKLNPILYLPAEATRTYYNITLQPGPNQLVIFTTPNPINGVWWGWGVGATMFDRSGKVFTEVSESQPVAVAQ